MAMRPARVGVLVLLGALLGGGSMLALQQAVATSWPRDAAPAASEDAAPARERGTTTAGADRASPAPPPLVPLSEKPAPVPEPDGRVLLAWTSGGLRPSLAGDVAALPRVEDVTVVHGGLAELAASADADGRAVDAPEEGYVIPLDVLAYDPATYTAFAPKSLQADLAGLGEGEALLTTTSAGLRDLGQGATLTLAGGHTLTVAGVVDGEAVGGAEAVVTAATGAALGVDVPRYLLVAYRGERAATEQAIRDVARDAPLRLRGPGETPVFRHGDAVLTQAAVKERFGEFSYRRRGDGGALELDAAWVREHVVTAEVPLLGEVRCHRAVIKLLGGALAELEERGLGGLVDPEGFAGCHVPRFVASGESVSRHSWGIAVDLNWPKNPLGRAGTQDERLVEVMERWGFGWGGGWLVPDPAHFEYVRPPTGAAGAP